MISRPSVLCPIDFSNSSRAALRYAVTIAEHCSGRLTLLTVNDPLVTEAAEMRLGPRWMPEDSRRELHSFYMEALQHRLPALLELQIEVGTGKPAPEILRVARELQPDLIVMSTHGLTGIRKLFFGATTERVLRETSVPVLVTPATDTGPLSVEDLKRRLRRILVPVDLSAATARQVDVGRRLADTLDLPLLLTHVVEPVRFPFPIHAPLPSVNAERRARAEQTLETLVSAITSPRKPEALTAYGDPAEEIAQIARDRQVGLIVMGLHASPRGGPGMGSVTYRVLCLTPTLVLALPPAPAGASSGFDALLTAEARTATSRAGV